MNEKEWAEAIQSAAKNKVPEGMIDELSHAMDFVEKCITDVNIDEFPPLLLLNGPVNGRRMTPIGEIIGQPGKRDVLQSVIKATESDTYILLTEAWGLTQSFEPDVEVRERAIEEAMKGYSYGDISKRDDRQSIMSVSAASENGDDVQIIIPIKEGQKPRGLKVEKMVVIVSNGDESGAVGNLANLFIGIDDADADDVILEGV